jgi:hypothetical protein
MEFVVVTLEATGSLSYTHTQLMLFALDSRLDTLGDCRVVGGGTEDVCTNARHDVVLASLALHSAHSDAHVLRHECTVIYHE